MSYFIDFLQCIPGRFSVPWTPADSVNTGIVMGTNEPASISSSTEEIAGIKMLILFISVEA